MRGGHDVEEHLQHHELHVPILHVVRVVDVLRRELVRVSPEHHTPQVHLQGAAHEAMDTISHGFGVYREY